MARKTATAKGAKLKVRKGDKVTVITGRDKGKSGKMPPGLARHIERYGTLPPGLAKKPLPPGLAGRLPATTAGRKRVIVGTDVVLVQAATGVILDIIKDVVRNRDK